MATDASASQIVPKAFATVKEALVELHHDPETAAAALAGMADAATMALVRQQSANEVPEHYAQLSLLELAGDECDAREGSTVSYLGASDSDQELADGELEPSRTSIRPVRGGGGGSGGGGIQAPLTLPTNV